MYKFLAVFLLVVWVFAVITLSVLKISYISPYLDEKMATTLVLVESSSKEPHSRLLLLESLSNTPAQNYAQFWVMLMAGYSSSGNVKEALMTFERAMRVLKDFELYYFLSAKWYEHKVLDSDEAKKLAELNLPLISSESIKLKARRCYKKLEAALMGDGIVYYFRLVNSIENPGVYSDEYCAS